MADKRSIAEALLRLKARDANGRPIEPDYSFALPPEDIDPNAPVWKEAEPSFLDSLVDRFELNRAQMADADNVSASVLQAAGADTPILKQRRTDQTKKFNQLRPWYQAEDPLQGAAEFGAAAAGTLAGSVADPINFVGGVGKRALDTFVNNAGISGLADSALQLTDSDKTVYNPASEKYNPATGGFDAQLDEQGNPIEAWNAPEFDPMRTLASMGAGGTLATGMAGQIPQLPREIASAVTAPAKKVTESGRKIAEAINSAAYTQGGKLLPPEDPINGWNLTPEEAMDRWDQIRLDSGQNKFADDALTLDETNWKADRQKKAANDDAQLFTQSKRAQKAGHIPASDLEPVAPNNKATPEKLKALATARRTGERRVGKTIWKNPSNFGSPTGYDQSEILHNPTIRQIKALKNKAPYGELRWLADTITGDIHVWPAAHGFHNDAAKAMGIQRLDDGGQMIHGYFDDSYPVDFDAANTIDDLLNQQYKGQEFMNIRDAMMSVTGRTAPHAPGTINKASPRERIAAELTRQDTPPPQIREEYPGIYSFTKAEGETVDPRNALAMAIKNNPNYAMYDFREIEPGRWVKGEHFDQLRTKARTKTLKDRLARDVGPNDHYDGPATTGPGSPGYADPEFLKDDWERYVRIYPRLTRDNIETHGLDTISKYDDYIDTLMDRDGGGRPEVQNKLQKERRLRMEGRFNERFKKGEESLALDDNRMIDDIGGRFPRMSREDIEKLAETRPDLKGKQIPTNEYLRANDFFVDHEGKIDVPVEHWNSLLRSQGKNPMLEGGAYKQLSPKYWPQMMRAIDDYNEGLGAAESIGDALGNVEPAANNAVARALMDQQAKAGRSGSDIYGAFENKRPTPTKAKAPLVKKTKDGFEYRERQQKAGTYNEDFAHINGDPIMDLGPEPEDVIMERQMMAKGKTRYDDPTMYGDPTGVPYTTIYHNPSLKQIAELQKKSPYGEVRYLTDGNGDTHFWPANDAYHNDVGDFLGVPHDYAIHGNFNEADFKRAMSYEPDNVQQFVFANQRAKSEWRPRDPETFGTYDDSVDTGVANHSDNFNYEEWWDYNGHALPVWQWERARFDQKIPGRRVGESMDKLGGALRKEEAVQQAEANIAASKAKADAGEELPNDTVFNPSFDTMKKPWLRSKYTSPNAVSKVNQPAAPSGVKEEVSLPKIGNRPTPRKTDVANKLGSYRDRQQNVGDSDVNLDEGIDAAGMFDGNKDWSKVPVKEVHAQQRKALMDPKRPVPTEADAPKLPSLREAKKVLTPEETEKMMTERRTVLGKRNDEEVVKATTLGSSITKGVTEHAKLSPAERAINLKIAEEVLSKAMGNKNGQVTRLFTKNAKLLKAEKGYDGNWVKEPMILANKQGIETTGMALAPSSEMRGFKTCPNSASCRDACLGFKAGQYFQGGVDGGPQTASRKRTQALLDHPEAYGVVMYEEIAAARRTAIKNGNILGVRLNVLSDVDPKVYKSLMESFPDVWFYDYTKMNYRPIAPNHHVTYSSTGVSNKDVTNLNQNWSRMRAKLNSGDNVAMAFTDKKSIPKFVLDEETGKMYRTVDGVGTDFRPSDLMETDGKEGVIVALKNMEQSTHKGVEHMETAGFLVPYDAKYKRATSKTGKPGKYIRDERGQLIPTSEIAVIPKQVSRKSVREEARVKITVGGKDMSDYGGQSSGYTPDQSTAQAAGMTQGKRKQSAPDAGDPPRNPDLVDVTDRPGYVRQKPFDRDPNNDDIAPMSLIKRNADRRIKHSTGAEGKPESERTTKDYLYGIDQEYKIPFEDEYKPGSLPADAKPGDKLQTTTRGTPLVARNVIGRRTVGGANEPLSREQALDIAKYLLKDSPRRKAVDQIAPGNVSPGGLSPFTGDLKLMGELQTLNIARDMKNPVPGGVDLKAGDAVNNRININTGHLPSSQLSTLKHEMGHGILNELRMGKGDPIMHGDNNRKPAHFMDDTRDSAPPDFPENVERDMREIYHTNNAIPEELGHYVEDFGPWGNASPENDFYNSVHTNHELFAEFFKAAASYPDYAKSVAPKAYQWMAEQIDNDPYLREVVQLNSPKAVGALAAYLAYKASQEQQQEQQQ